MKYIFLLTLFLFSSIVFSENYRKIKINSLKQNEITELQKIGIPLDDAYQNRDGSIDLFINEYEFNILGQTAIKYDVLIDNWEKHYTNQRANTLNSFALSKYSSQYNVNGFTKGSMGGYYTLSEVWDNIDNMILNYPNLISTKDSIGASDEGRPIYAVCISDNPNINEEEPEVLYTALIHAREPESMMQMIYFMYYLLENYGTDSEATYLIENREMYFIPVINPDGYKYNETTNPNGGGMWRKNRQYNIDGSYGVDLNRNYGYNWGYDDIGSNSNPSSNTYRGKEGFSEPETQTVSKYCKTHNFKFALNYHSYGNLLITPWGYIPAETQDSTFYREIASDMTKYNHYRWGYSSDIIYPVNGGSDDWFYGEQTTKNKIYSFTPEVGSSSDGFWPDEDRIIPLAEENLYPNLYLAWVAGGFVNTLCKSFDKEYYTTGDTGHISITIKNKGLEDIDNIKLATSISDNGELLYGQDIYIGNIPSQTSTTIENAIKFIVKDSAMFWDSLSFALKYYSSNLFISEDNYSIVIAVNEAPTPQLPTEYSLSQNYPNPFNPSTVIKYSIPEDVRGEKQEVRLMVYDILGRKVATLTNKNQYAGNYEVKFDAAHLTSGIYFYRIQSGTFTESKKMLFIK